jgi:hypothetical protein
MPETKTLHELLLAAAPPNDYGRKTIMHLAEVLEVSKATIWHWIKKDFLPPERATQIVVIADGRVTLDELHRFVYRG